MKKIFFNAHFFILEENYEMALYVIGRFPTLGVEEKHDELIVCFAAADWNEDVQKRLTSELSEFCPEADFKGADEVEDKNWNEEIEKNTPAIIVSDKIGIAPAWKLHELNTEIKIQINPKMSFGTGQHATTKLVCQLMENTVGKDEFWIDAGTGTGALAILAIKLGAKSVYAFDNDEWSALNAQENCEINGVAENVTVEMIDIFKTKLPPAQGIVANMFLNIINASLETFFETLKDSKGKLIVSGILKYDKDLVIAKAISCGFELINYISEDEWSAFYFQVK